MDELYAFLFAGLFIILLLFVFFGGAHVDVDGSYNSSGGAISEGNDLDWKEIELGDLISEECTVHSTQLLDSSFSVQNGVLFGSTDYERTFGLDREMVENQNNATLSFEIDDTNNYGELSLSLGNETFFYQNALRGEHLVELPKLSEENILRVSTKSSSWRIWAPSKYQISNLTLDVSYSSKEVPFVEFDLPYYVYNSFYRGELRFDSVTSADISVILNGFEVYTSSNCYGDTTVTLARSDVVPEENTIEIISEDDYRLEQATLYLYYRS